MSASTTASIVLQGLWMSFRMAVQLYVAGCYFEDKVVQRKGIDQYLKVVRTLDLLGGDEARKTLAVFLDDHDPNVSVIAAIQLAKLMPERARETLRRIENTPCQLRVLAGDHGLMWDTYGIGETGPKNPKP